MALLSDEDYRARTGDYTSDAAAVVDALAFAQADVEEWLRRPLEAAVRTETLRPTMSGMLYPAATPLRVVPAGYAIRGAGLLATPGGWAGPWLAGGPHPGFTITYTGGWDPPGGTLPLPSGLAQGICEAAWDRLHPEALPPAGLAQATVGDTSVQFAFPVNSTRLSAKVLQAIRGYRRRDIAPQPLTVPW